MKTEKNTGKVDSVDDLLNFFLKDAEYEGVPALSWLEQGLCIDGVTNAMKKPDLLRLLSKAVLCASILYEKNAKLLGLAIEAGRVAFIKEEVFMKKAQHEISKKGGEGRGEKYQPLRELAEKLVSAKKFKSRRNAAQTIMPDILAEGKRLGIELSKEQAEITITGWLKKSGLPANI